MPLTRTSGGDLGVKVEGQQSGGLAMVEQSTDVRTEAVINFNVQSLDPAAGLAFLTSPESRKSIEGIIANSLSRNGQVRRSVNMNG